MPISDAQRRAAAKYDKENMDSIKAKMKKEQGARIRTHCEERGETLSAFLCRAAETQMQIDGGGSTPVNADVAEIGTAEMSALMEKLGEEMRRPFRYTGEDIDRMNAERFAAAEAFIAEHGLTWEQIEEKYFKRVKEEKEEEQEEQEDEETPNE